MGSSPRSTYKNLYQHLQKEFRSGVISLPDDREVLVQLIYSALLENRPAAVALEAFETIENSFIDWNELRVSTASELCDLVPTLSNARNSCERLRQTLQVIFQATYKFDLEEWREKGEEAFRDYLGTIRYVTPFMKSYTVAAVFRRSAVPLDEGALRVLRLLDLVDVNAENQEVPIGLERVFSKSDTLVFARMLHELGAMLMDETQSARAMRILKAVDPESAQRTFVPLVDTDDFDPFRINRKLVSLRRNSPMKMSFDADMDDVEEEDISADDSLEEEIPLENAEETDGAFAHEEAAAPKRKEEKKAKGQKPAEAKAPAETRKPAETRVSAEVKKPAEPKAPVKAKKPAEVKAPVKAKKPAEPKAPVKAKKPAEVKAPVRTKKPAEAKAPVRAKKPAEAKAPVKAKKPAEAKAPVKVKKSAEAKAPVKAKKPAEAKAPVKAKKPAEAKAPVKAKKPAEAKAPVKVKKSAAAKSPVKAKKPAPKPAAKAPVQRTLFAKGNAGKKSGGKKK